MYNDPELNPKYLGTITSDFVKVADYLKEASYQIRTRKFSEYPIFVISKVPVPIGSLLYDIGFAGNDWNYYASFIEDFRDRDLLDDVETFKQAYKDPEEFCCLFVVEPEFTNFVFIPYPESEF
jgi:hypothetical protein